MYTSGAAEVAEGGTYGEAALKLVERTRPVQKIAVYLPVTDEQFEDEDGAEAYVNDRMTLQIRQRLSSQALLGDGSAPNLLGTTNVTGILTQALGTDPIPDAFYKLFRKIRVTGRAEPSLAFIHPEDWEKVRLLRRLTASTSMDRQPSPVRLACGESR